MKSREFCPTEFRKTGEGKKRSRKWLLWTDTVKIKFSEIVISKGLKLANTEREGDKVEDYKLKKDPICKEDFVKLRVDNYTSIKS